MFCKQRRHFSSRLVAVLHVWRWQYRLQGRDKKPRRGDQLETPGAHKKFAEKSLIKVVEEKQRRVSMRPSVHHPSICSVSATTNTVKRRLRSTILGIAWHPTALTRSTVPLLLGILTPKMWRKESKTMARAEW